MFREVVELVVMGWDGWGTGYRGYCCRWECRLDGWDGVGSKGRASVKKVQYVHKTARHSHPVRLESGTL